MKMYILVKESVPVGHAITSACHAAVACTQKFIDTPEVQAWLSGVFHKVVCKVNDKEFENAKKESDLVVITESALDQAEIAIAFKPRSEWPKMFKFLRLYK